MELSTGFVIPYLRPECKTFMIEDLETHFKL